MFTGIVQELGVVKNIVQEKGLKRFTLKSKTTKKEQKIGSSVSVNGACLTVVAIKWDHFMVEAVENTLKTTNLGSLKVGDEVNLEPALLATGRLDGHFVSGHIDTIGKIKKIKRVGQQEEYFIQIPRQFITFMVDKGSISIDGISLTIAGIRGNIIKVVVIPHTSSKTNLKNKKVNSTLNIEFDMLGKYALNQMGTFADIDQSQLEARFLEFSKFAYRASMN